MASPLFLSVLGLLAINGVTMLRFWQDKQRSIARQWRIPESDLLGLAVVGGTPGAFLARRLFRHKTRKQPFSARLETIAILQAAASVGFAIFELPAGML